LKSRFPGATCPWTRFVFGGTARERTIRTWLDLVAYDSAGRNVESSK
jgi:hypothetical protein